jgi:hypothetical protein
MCGKIAVGNSDRALRVAPSISARSWISVELAETV